MKKILWSCTLLIVLICVMTSCSHEHQWSEWQSSKVATCTQDGVNMRFCDDCGESQSMPISATGHIWSEWATTRAVSCTQDGLKERTCSCGEKETQTIYASGHAFSAWHTTKEATCTVNGSKERSCACGEKETDTIVASHAWKDATCTEAKKCSKCGLTDGSALGHTCSIGMCVRCFVKVNPTVNLPSTPMTVRNGIYSMEITELSYEFDSLGLIISFSGKTINGIDSEYIGFRFKILDENGYVIDTGLWMETGYKTGDKFTAREYVSYYISGSSEYTIIITDLH